jgi:hypothetical protein
MPEKKEIVPIIIVIIVVAVIIGVFVFLAAKETNSYSGELSLEKMATLSSCPLTTDKDAFAKCLTEKGWAMYGAEWCSHCKSQKELFGSSFQYIKYIECSDSTELCTAKGINGLPTWLVEPL